MKPRLLAVKADSDFPPHNIALEEALRARGPGSSGYLLSYINAPSVIIGRNQNPEQELSSFGAPDPGIPVYRRTSGGGAVYHDKGNLNWTFIIPGGLDDRGWLLALVIGALRNLGIPASAGSRGEVVAGGYKIGGTASAAGRDVLLFHGTILVDADLMRLTQVLAAHQPSYAGTGDSGLGPRGVASVPSTVGNATWFHPGLRTEDVIIALAEAAEVESTVAWTTLIAEADLERLAETFSSPAWIYRISQKG